MSQRPSLFLTRRSTDHTSQRPFLANQRPLATFAAAVSSSASSSRRPYASAHGSLRPRERTRREWPHIPRCPCFFQHRQDPPSPCCAIAPCLRAYLRTCLSGNADCLSRRIQVILVRAHHRSRGSIANAEASIYSTWRSSLIIAFIACYLMWFITFMAQLNPLIAPKSPTVRAGFEHE